VSSFSFDIDPLKVLGVPADASLAQIRDAYRQKVKRYHPDAGGEDWAFRVLAQAYEVLCSARVIRAAAVEAPAPPHQAAARPRREPAAETVHSGIHDTHIEAARMVAVEHLCVRYLWDDASYLWITQGMPEEERFLSCSLNIAWPDELHAGRDPGADAATVVATLNEVFDAMVISTRVVSSRHGAGDDRFAGWLSYSSFDRSWKALKMLHEALNRRGLGLRQWSRDLFLPRAWRSDRAPT
jgi:hypothetical protein